MKFSLKNLGHFLKKKNTRDPEILSFHKERDWMLLLIFFFIFLVASFLGHGFLYNRYIQTPPPLVTADGNTNLKKDKELYNKADSWLKERERKHEEVRTMLVPQDPSL